MSATVLISDQSKLPQLVQEKLAIREAAREKKDFTTSDQLRNEIRDLGYLVNDQPTGLEILKIGDEDLKPAKRFLVLFGSGEIAPSSVDIYRQIFLELGKRHLKIVEITTPAGFQPNVEHVYGEIKEYWEKSLPDFQLSIDIIHANTRNDANDPAIVEQLNRADIIFMGPGSPTYAAKNLKGTRLLTNVIDRVKNGATLVLASAATIACSRYCLPVYEIYKVGEDLHWADGLNLFKEIWHETTIIPHFNNTEGGADLDTSHCFVGTARFDKLLPMLKEGTPVLGLDEHTALIIDLDTGGEIVRGKGTIHVL